MGSDVGEDDRGQKGQLAVSFSRELHLSLRLSLGTLPDPTRHQSPQERSVRLYGEEPREQKALVSPDVGCQVCGCLLSLLASQPTEGSPGSGRGLEECEWGAQHSNVGTPTNVAAFADPCPQPLPEPLPD